MDILNNPELKNKYEQCKKTVKMWESSFRKKFKRIPSKYDIREAHPEIKQAYKSYFQMKTAALEESLLDIADFSIDSNIENNKNDNSLNVESNTNISNVIAVDENTMDVNYDNIEPQRLSNDKVWGSHLNKTNKQIKKVKSGLNKSVTLSEKMFVGSKFAKRNPRKSMSFSRNKSKTDIDIGTFSASQPENTISTNEEFEPIFTDQLKINTVVNSNTQSVSIRQNSLDQQLTRTLNRDWLDRVSRVNGLNPDLDMNFRNSNAENSSNRVPELYGLTNIKYVETPVTEFFSDSDEYVANSASEDESRCSVAKRRRINVNGVENFSISENSSNKVSVIENDINNIPTIANNVSLIENNVKSNVLIANRNESNVSIETSITNCSVNIISHENVLSVEEKVSSSENQSSFISNVSSSNLKRTVTRKTPSQRIKKSVTQRVKKKSSKENTVIESQPENQTQVAKRKIPMRKVKIKRNTESVNDEFNENLDEDPFSGDDDRDPDFSIEPHNKLDEILKNNIDPPKNIRNVKKLVPRKVAEKKPKNGKITNTNLLDSDEEIGPKEYIDFTRSELPPTVPRFELSNVKAIPNPSTSSKKQLSKSMMAKTKLEQKVESRNLNENYVRINIQKKIFARGKKTMTFGKFKKQQWRANKKAKALAGPNMDMGGCDGGMLTCFKCGDVGHFARNCNVLKGDDLLPLSADDADVSPFPTLEEASVMAKTSALAIHTTRSTQQVSTSKDDADNSESNIEGDGTEDKDEITLTNEEKIEINADDFVDDELTQLLDVIATSSQPVSNLVPKELLDSSKVQPLYNLKEDGSVIQTPPEVYEALNKFGHTSFRPGQELAIMRILSGQSTLVTLSTGSGKSLCYQLPAYLYNKYSSSCIAIVVSPLVSLMDDQVARSENLACLHTGMTPTARKKTLETLKSGCLTALLISPEAIVAGFESLIRQLPPVSFACIDEVHCVSQWSHNFRPSYLTVCRVLRERLGVQVMLGLTATAPVSIQRNILEHLNIRDGNAGLIGAAPLPDNLTLTVSKDTRRDAALIAMLRSDRMKDFRSIVIYCTRRDECDRIAGVLRTVFREDGNLPSDSKKRKRVNYSAEPYHAGLAASRRRTVQNAFMTGNLRIVVATVAFGMGINKSNIRAVIHYNMPKNFESYVQEVGRAGRDELPAHCHLFLNTEGNDQKELRRHIFSNSLDRHVIRKLLQKVFIPCECKSRGITCPKHEVAIPIKETVELLDIPEENISTLLCYLELHERSFVQVLSSAYTHCKIISYAGLKALKHAAQSSAPLAMAVAMQKQYQDLSDTSNVIEFPVVDIAAAIGWESGMVKHHLKNLEWTTENGCPKRSTLTVQFSSLGFRVRAPGDLSPNDLDFALDYLYERVVKQEHTELMQLNKVFEAFNRVASTTYAVTEEEGNENSNMIKSIVLNYFQSDRSNEDISILKPLPVNEEHIASDVRCLISMYRENNFTGRAIARIFYGIPSPNYPAIVWGRCKFWRSHLQDDFNIICKIATHEILRMKC